MVSPNEVGNGLQSVLDIAFAIDETKTRSNYYLLVVEEPEAFLHPSAQRELVNALRKYSEKRNTQVIVTTHSPIVLDECKFPQTVLVRGQKFYYPNFESDRRDEINSTLLSMPHAEAFFASGVLLVEGPGDRAFFQTLIARLRRVKSGAPLTKLVIQETGSKTSFAPWLNLFQAYGSTTDRPIRWHAIFDADAAKSENGTKAIARAIRDSGNLVSSATHNLLDEFVNTCLLYTSPSPRDRQKSRMPSSA